MFGKGLACVRGFPVEQHSIEDLERIYWAFCTHLGYLVSNNSFGHRMVRVQEEVLPEWRAAGARYQIARRVGDAQRRGGHPVAAVCVSGG